MDKLNIETPSNLIDSWYLVKDKYKNPIFTCNKNTEKIISKVHDDDCKYLLKTDHSKRKTLFNTVLVVDYDCEDGLFITENRYKGDNN